MADVKIEAVEDEDEESLKARSPVWRAVRASALAGACSDAEVEKGALDVQNDASQDEAAAAAAETSDSDAWGSGADVSLSGADSRQSGADAEQSDADAKQSGADAEQSGADARQSDADGKASGADVRQSDADCQASGEDARPFRVDGKPSNAGYADDEADIRGLFPWTCPREGGDDIGGGWEVVVRSRPSPRHRACAGTRRATPCPARSRKW